MGVIGRLDQEQILHHDAFHGREPRRHMLGVGVGLQNVLALDVDGLERAIDRGVDHVGNAQAGLGIEMHAPQRLERRPRRVFRDVAVARHLMREGAHVARALHVVLSAQRVHADALAPDIAGGHGEIGDGDHRGRALAVLGDAKPVIDGAIAAGGIEARRAADQLRRDAGDLLHLLRAVARLRHEGRPVLELVPIAAFAHECLVHQPLGHDDMGERGDHGDVGAGLERQMVVGFDMRRAHEVDAARIDDDQLGALAQALLHARGKHRMAVGGIGTDDQDDVGLLDGIEILRAGRGAVGGLEPVAGGRMAHPRASIDIVVAEGGAHELLHEIGLFVGAARGGDAAHRALAVFLLDALEFRRGVGDRLFPRHLPPRVGDLLADHRLQDAVFMRGVAIGEAALDAGMAAIGLAVLVGQHAHELVAAHSRP